MTPEAFKAMCLRAGYAPGVLRYEDYCGPDAFRSSTEIEPEDIDPKTDKIRMDAKEEEGRARAGRIDRFLNPHEYVNG